MFNKSFLQDVVGFLDFAEQVIEDRDYKLFDEVADVFRKEMAVRPYDDIKIHIKLAACFEDDQYKLFSKAAKFFRYTANRFPLDSQLKQQLVDWMVEYAEILPKASDRIYTLGTAANHASFGSKLEQQAVAGFVKQVESLPEASDRIEAFRDAANAASPCSKLEQQALLGFFKQVESLPEVSDRIDALYYAAHDAFYYVVRDAHAFPPENACSGGSSLEELALAGFFKQVESLPEVSDRIEAFRDAQKHAPFDSALNQQVRERIEKYSQAVSSNVSSRTEDKMFLNNMRKVKPADLKL